MAHVRIAMVALKDFEHGGECYAAGECFLVAPMIAAKMKYQREADYGRNIDENQRGTYRRRDLVAER